MKTFKDFQLLNEIGTGTKPYKTVMRDGGVGHAWFYYFTGDDGTDYKVQIVFKLNRISTGLFWYVANVEFESFLPDGKRSFDATNSGTKQMFRVMTTVVKSIKDAILHFHKKTGNKTKFIIYNAADKNAKSATAKNKLYAAYVKKIMKATVMVRGDSSEVKIPDRFYK